MNISLYRFVISLLKVEGVRRGSKEESLSKRKIVRSLELNAINIFSSAKDPVATNEVHIVKIK